MAHALIFSDIHIYPHKRKVERLEDCLKALDWVFQVARERKIEDIIFGGDLLHDRQRIDVFTYMRTWEILKRNMTGNLRLWLLLGNHDLWFAQKWSVSSIHPFSALPGVTVIDKPSRLKIAGAYFDFIPYTHDPIAALEELRQMGGKVPYAVGHLAMHGAKINAHHQADVVIEHDGDMVTVDPKIFKGYEWVFLGHYHAAQQIADNVEYIGSPLELSFGEAFQKKHIIDFDVAHNHREYIENTFSPKHLYLKPEDLNKHDLDNNFVIVLTDDISAADVTQLRSELLKEHELGSLQIRQVQRKNADDDTIIHDAKAILFKEDEMLERYMKEVPPDNLDNDTCLQVGKRIITEKNKVDVTI
jgi:DNA repair exonuclease SbcCD nuclease subunit